MCRELLQNGREREVREVILAYGLKDGSPEFLARIDAPVPRHARHVEASRPT
jgi:hypothetical protein